MTLFLSCPLSSLLRCSPALPTCRLPSKLKRGTGHRSRPNHEAVAIPAVATAQKAAYFFRQLAASKVNKEGKERYNEAIRTSRRTTNQIRWFKIAVSRTARGHDTKCLKRFSHFFNSNYITAELKQLFPMVKRHHLILSSRCWGRTIYGLLYAFPPA